MHKDKKNDGNLQGSISSEIVQLQDLIEINFSRYFLTGSIPEEILKIMNLSMNILNGIVQSTIGDMRSLLELHFLVNDLRL